MRKLKATLYIFSILLIIGCSHNEEFEKLNAKDFNNVVVSLNGSKVYESNKEDKIEGIINEININEKEFATEMSKLCYYMNKQIP
jgi:type III secretory pathway lipoprotein EscJ